MQHALEPRGIHTQTLSEIQKEKALYEDEDIDEIIILKFNLEN
jgi:hypothetical protein